MNELLNEMSRSRLTVFSLIIFALAVVPLNPLIGNVSATSSFTFSRTPSGYNNETGAFTLGSQLTYDSGYGQVCVMYDYFIFNAQAGQLLQGHAWIVGVSHMLFYLVVTSPYQLYSFQNSNCARGGSWSQISDASAINWTAPANGQYALIFATSGFYGGTVYFTQ